jgi:hypothetical protein
VCDTCRHPDFGVELGEPRRVAVHVRRQELQGDRVPELQIVGAEDLAHPAAAQAVDDAIAAAEDGAGSKAAVVDRAGAREPSAGGGGRLAAGRTGRVGVTAEQSSGIVCAHAPEV